MLFDGRVSLSVSYFVAASRVIAHGAPERCARTAAGPFDYHDLELTTQCRQRVAL